MCGIAAVLTFSGDEAAPLDVALLRHRGPDGQGEWRSPDGSLWLGHSRLAILDLSQTGAQPMVDRLTGNVIVYNGEVYNHPELRAELEKAGATFAGTSDTETVLAAYRHWGKSVFARLNGIFAIALYDAAKRTLILARDRLGIKPLYFVRRGGRLAFCSEVRPLVRHLGLRLSREGVEAYLQAGCSPHHQLLYDGLHEFVTGTVKEVNPDGREMDETFWPGPSFDLAQYQGISRADAVRHTRELLEANVRRQLLSDVPLASFLSGGIDSSIVTALAARLSSKRITTFSVGFTEAQFDESRFASEVADRFGTDHVHIRLSEEEILQNVKAAVLSMDLPSKDAINTFIVVRQASLSGFKVALSGLGGDELFGGYKYFRQIPYLKWMSLVPEWIRSMPPRYGKLRHVCTDVPKRVDAGLATVWWRRFANASTLASLGLTSPPIQMDPPPLLRDDFARISWAEMRHYMRDMLLRDCDQMSMANSLELRVPLLSNDLVEFAVS